MVIAGKIRAARQTLHAQQAAGREGWVNHGAPHPVAANRNEAYVDWVQRVAAWQTLDPSERVRPGPGAIATNLADHILDRGGIVDVWFLGDGTVMVDFAMPIAYLQAYDDASAMEPMLFARWRE